MVATGACFSCIPMKFGDHISPPNHCYGSGDRPAPKGVFGGFMCNCSCRNKKEAKEPTHEEVLFFISFMFGRDITKYGDLTPQEVEILCRDYYKRNNSGRD
jgi:hypothetical protein